jgi:hypothetical protein
MSDETNQSVGKGARGHLSPKEFSQISGLSLATVHRYLKKGKLPFRQPGGPRGRILIPVDALQSVPAGATGAGSDRGATAAREPSPDAAERPAALPGPRPKWTHLGGARS